jgi:hypothetical protein
MGSALDAMSSVVEALLLKTNEALDHFGGMIYCDRPGSALELGVALTSINTWMMFGKHDCKLLTYHGQDMSIYLCRRAKSTWIYGTAGNSIVRTKDNTHIKMLAIDKLNLENNVLFLDTRCIQCEKDQNVRLANDTHSHM